jgi:L-fucose isomerase-like protein
LTDSERESLVRSFLTEAVEQKCQQILKGLLEIDSRVKDVVREVAEDTTMAISTTRNETAMAKAMREAEDKRHEAAMDKLAAKFAPQMHGHVRFFGTDRGKVMVSTFNGAMKKKRLRQVN